MGVGSSHPDHWGTLLEGVPVRDRGMLLSEHGEEEQIGLCSAVRASRRSVEMPVQGERAPGDPISVYYLLEDDGEFKLPMDEHGLTAESDVRIAIGRRVVDEVDVNGNTLRVTGMDEQSFRPECLPYPDVTVPTSRPPTGTMADPFYMDIKAYGIFAEDGIHDYTEDGADEPTSARMIFTFLDAYAQPVCKVTYDISGDRAIAPKKPWTSTAVSGYGASVWLAHAHAADNLALARGGEVLTPLSITAVMLQIVHE